MLEFDPFVIEFGSQPLLIKYSYKGKRYKYFPDYMVRTNENRIIIYEVKPNSKIKEEKNIIKFQAGIKYCNKNGWTYCVVTDEEIRKGSLIENLDKLRKHKIILPQENIIQILKRIVEQNKNISIGNIKKAAVELSEKEVYSHLYYLIYNHQFNVNLYELLTDETEIYSM